MLLFLQMVTVIDKSSPLSRYTRQVEAHKETMRQQKCC